MFKSAVLESSTESADSDYSEEKSCPSTSIHIPSKREHRNVVWDQLAEALGHTQVSDQGAAMILFESSRPLGNSPKELALNRPTTKGKRKKLRK